MTPSTPFPNYLIDQVMPALKDTEWRLLCVVVRQTLGWRGKRPGQRKEFDWLTHSQLQTRTGRSSEALSRALDILVRKGLVEVWDDQGRCLITPASRRRCCGRLYYRLGSAVRGRLDTKSEMATQKSEIRKAKTTKETWTKNLPIGRETLDPQETPGEKLKPGTKSRKQFVNGQRAGAEPNPDVRRFIRAYTALFQERTMHGDPPPVAWGRDGKLVKELLRLYSYERLLDLLQSFFASEDEWVVRRGYALDAFRSMIGRLLLSEPREVNRGHHRSCSQRNDHQESSSARIECIERIKRNEEDHTFGARMMPSYPQRPYTIRTGRWTRAVARREGPPESDGHQAIGS